MKKKKGGDTKKAEIPQSQEKYQNLNRLEEIENRLHEEKNIIDNLKRENHSLFDEVKRKDIEIINASRIYERTLDERNRAYLNIEEQLNKIKLERTNIEKELTEEYNQKIVELLNTHDKQIKTLTEELENFQEKYRKNKEKRKNVKTDYDTVKAECDRVNLALYNSIQSYEKRIADIKENFENEMKEEKKRVDEFLKFNEDLRESDLYSVYKDLRRKFEEKLKECIEYKDKSEKISDENKVIKLNLDNSDGLIKECAKVQTNQQKMIKQLKETINQKNEEINKLKEEGKKEIFELNFKLTKLIEDREKEIKKLKQSIKIKSDENSQLRSLSQMILDQRSEIEQFFIESLEEAKAECYKKKKEAERKGNYFPNLSKKYDDKIASGAKNLDIKDLSPEDKEKVLRLLFAKINENYKPKSYKNIDKLKLRDTEKNENEQKNNQMEN